jgi:glutamine amidotransferase PdxT
MQNKQKLYKDNFNDLDKFIIPGGESCAPYQPIDKIKAVAKTGKQFYELALEAFYYYL